MEPHPRVLEARHFEPGRRAYRAGVAAAGSRGHLFRHHKRDNRQSDSEAAYPGGAAWSAPVAVTRPETAARASVQNRDSGAGRRARQVRAPAFSSMPAPSPDARGLTSTSPEGERYIAAASQRSRKVLLAARSPREALRV